MMPEETNNPAPLPEEIPTTPPTGETGPQPVAEPVPAASLSLCMLWP